MATWDFPLLTVAYGYRAWQWECGGYESRKWGAADLLSPSAQPALSEHPGFPGLPLGTATSSPPVCYLPPGLLLGASARLAGDELSWLLLANGGSL